MQNIFTNIHCLTPYTCKCCIVFKQCDELNFDGIARKRQKCFKILPVKKFALYSMHVVHTAINLVHRFITDNHFKTKHSSIILLESFCQGIEILSVSCTYFGNHFYTNDWLYLLIQNSAL